MNLNLSSPLWLAYLDSAALAPSLLSASPVDKLTFALISRRTRALVENCWVKGKHTRVFDSYFPVVSRKGLPVFSPTAVNGVESHCPLSSLTLCAIFSFTFSSLGGGDGSSKR